MRSQIPMAEFLRRLTVFLGAMAWPGIASAREIIVAPSGGDFTTVTAGVNAAQAGDIITVRAGTSLRSRLVRPQWLGRRRFHHPAG